MFPEFDELRVAMEGIHFGMTDDQIDGYVRSVRDTIDFAGMDLPSIDTMLSIPDTVPVTVAVQAALTGAVLQLPAPGLSAPDATSMIQTVQDALTDANLRVDVDVVMQTVDPATAATLAWLQTPEAAAFLGVTAMASGGIVDSPTLALIGESGPEAVIPLGQGGMGGGTTVNVNVAGSILTESEIGEIVQEQLLRIQGRNQTLEFA